MGKKNSCIGSCCERFVLDLSIHKLKKSYEKWYQCKGNFIYRGKEVSIVKDIHLIYPMVIPLDGGKKMDFDPATGEKSSGCYHYSCKHYNNKEKMCTIYDTRPEMCRGYPYGNACRYKGCSFKNREKKEVKK